MNIPSDNILEQTRLGETYSINNFVDPLVNILEKTNTDTAQVLRFPSRAEREEKLRILQAQEKRETLPMILPAEVIYNPKERESNRNLALSQIFSSNIIFLDKTEEENNSIINNLINNHIIPEMRSRAQDDVAKKVYGLRTLGADPTIESFSSEFRRSLMREFDIATKSYPKARSALNTAYGNIQLALLSNYGEALKNKVDHSQEKIEEIISNIKKIKHRDVEFLEQDKNIPRELSKLVSKIMRAFIENYVENLWHEDDLARKISSIQELIAKKSA